MLDRDRAIGAWYLYQKFESRGKKPQNLGRLDLPLMHYWLICCRQSYKFLSDYCSTGGLAAEGRGPW